MKIQVLENTKVICFKAENEMESFFVGIISGKGSKRVAYRPKDEDHAEVRLRYDDLIDKLVSGD